PALTTASEDSTNTRKTCKDVRKDQGGRFLGRKDDKINLIDRSTFLKGHPLTLPNSTKECDKCVKEQDRWKKIP
ncbi:hypothetical protein, partial [Streptococcus anginosus]|uniref:hypothetical protein n=1 Tax=Streptococcus anginosus TaxID=1328 RepID=UPI0021F88962